MQGEDKAASLFRDEAQDFDYGDPHVKQIRKHKHDKLKYRMLSFIEQNFLKGNHLAGFKNYELIHPKSSNQ